MPRPLLTTNPIEVTDTGHLTELLYDDGENDEVLVCAAHGGAVEPGTAEQAIELATRLGATCWACVGFDTDAGAADYPQPTCSSEEVFIDLSSGPNHQSVDIRDRFSQFLV